MPPAINTALVMEFEIFHDEAHFQMNGVTVASVVAPAGIPAPVGNMRMFLICRTYVGAVAPATAPQISFGECVVLQKILATYEPWGETLCALGQGSYQLPVAGFGQSATYANNAVPATRVLTNTTVADAGWGGLFVITPTFAANTDYVLFAPQVPIGFQLMVRQVVAHFMNLGAAQPATVLNLQVGIALNSSAVSLATVDGTGTTAPRRLSIGQFRLAPSAAIGDLPNPVEVDRPVAYPWPVDSGRFLHIILRSKQTQTATASQVLDGGVMINGYFR